MDNFTKRLVTIAVTCSEKVVVDGVDRVATVSKLWARLLAKDTFAVTLKSGEVL